MSRGCSLVSFLFKSQDRKLSDVERGLVCRNGDDLPYQQSR